MLSIQKQGQKIKNYLRPATVDDALQLLHDHQDHGRLIAGGTDLMIELDRGQRSGVDTLIDISAIDSLRNITVDGDTVHLGALVTHNDVVGSAALVAHALPLAQACWEVGSPQLRNRATVVGNVVTASPANDTITPLIALGTTVSIASVRGRRTVSLDEFYQGVRQSVLAADEMVTHLSFAPLSDQQRGIYVKLGLRKAQAISVVHLAIILTFEGEAVRDARIALGSVAPTIVRIREAEEVLVGRALTAEAAVEAAREAAAVPRPIDDLRGSAVYRTELIEVMVRRALTALAEGRERETWPRDPVFLRSATQNSPVSKPAAGPAISIDAETPISCLINGVETAASGGAGRSLLHWLREEVRLPNQSLAVGSKEGCNEGECGACTVFLNGEAVMACLTPAGAAAGGDVVTIEGLARDGELHPLQRTFVEAGAVQCGFCIPGFIMSGVKLLEEVGQPTDEQIMQGLSGNLCRCTGYYKIIEAVHLAAGDSAPE